MAVNGLANDIGSSTTAQITNGDVNVDGSGGRKDGPLDIAIVGAGIGGLTAAIALRRNGHNVSVGYSWAGVPLLCGYISSHLAD